MSSGAIAPSDRKRSARSTGTAAPIVLLHADKGEKLPDAIAPGLATLGFMLPTTPLHLLILARMDRPVVMTSGNVSDEPQVIDDDAARRAARRNCDVRAGARPRNRQSRRRLRSCA